MSKLAPPNLSHPAYLRLISKADPPPTYRTLQVSFYAEALPLLHKYGGAASGLKGSSTFRQIALESEGVAREIKTLLRKRLTEKKDSEVSEEPLHAYVLAISLVMYG